MGCFFKRFFLPSAGWQSLQIAIVFMLLFIGQVPLVHAANSITGVVSLPDGEIAPAGGISLTVSVSNQADRESKDLFIPAGEASVSYTLDLPVSPGSTWVVSYLYSGDLPYLPKGYYSALSTATGTTWPGGMPSTKLDGDSSHTGIDMILLPGIRISGVVSLPAGQFAPAGGVSVDVVVSRNYPISASTPAGSKRHSVLIPEGEASAPYILTIAPWQQQTQYIYYEYSGSLEYLPWGFYAPSGTTVQEVRRLPLDRPQSSINLRLLTGSKISGSVHLPSGSVAAAGGVWVDVTAEEGNFSYKMKTRVFIAEGQTSASYDLIVPSIYDWMHRLSYSYPGPGTYLSRGYYNPSGTSAENATLIAGGTDQTGIDLTLLTGNRISGNFTLPAGQVAPTGGLQVHIQAYDTDLGDFSGVFSIPEGQSSVSYGIAVPVDSLAQWQLQYHLGYQLYSNLAVPRKGYYTPSGTTWDEDATTLLPGGQDHGNVNLTPPAPSQIRGSISLPPGEVAPAGGVAVSIHSLSFSNNSAYTQVVIPEGAFSATYSLQVPTDGSDQIKLYYSYAGDMPYLPRAYFSNSGSVNNPEQATLLAGGGNHDHIDFTLLEGLRFSGEVKLPSGETAAAGGIFITVSAYDRNSNQHMGQGKLVYIKPGAASAPYALVLPYHPDAALTLSYENESRWGELRYLRTGYYASTGTTWDVMAATLLDTENSRENLDLTLLTDSRISGNLSLPAGQVAPSGGLMIHVRAFSDQPDSKQVEQHFFIDQGVNAIPYALVVPPSAPQQWRISYSYNGSTGNFHHLGYHATSGTTWEFSQATVLAGGMNHTGINLALIAQPQISGTISLPSGEVAPTGGTEVYVRGMPQNQEYCGDGEWFFIAEGETSVAYAINIQPGLDTTWIIGYGYNGSAPYLPAGYYAVSGTQPNLAQASLLPGGHSLSGIDLTLLPGQRISGTLALPQGETAPPGGMQVSISATNQEGDYLGLFYAQIPGGDSSVPYIFSANADPGTNLSISYTHSGSLLYLHKGYYRDAGTTWDKSSATILPGGSDLTGIDLTLLPGSRISGQVSLPAGELAPAGGLYVHLDFSDRDRHLTHSKFVHIPAGEASAPYGIALLPDATANWAVSYRLSKGGMYLSQGYYSASGTTWKASEAALLAGDSSHPDSNLTLLTGKRISGSLSLPAGDVASAKSMTLRMAVEDESGVEANWQYITIKRGHRSAGYTLATIPDDTKSWIASYSYPYENTPYSRSGFYNSIATTWNKAAATILAGGADHSDINLVVLRNHKISGQISLPLGDVAPAGSIVVGISASRQQSSSTESQTSITIEEGDSKAPYTLWLDPDDEAQWVLQYSYHGTEPYMNNAYYAAAGTTWDKAAATLLDGKHDHAGINLELLKKLRFSGTVSLPAGEAAPSGGIALSIQFDTQSTWVEIEEGNFSTPYELWVPINPNQTSPLSYWLPDSGAYLRYGYYTSTGTTWDYFQGEPFRANANHQGIDLTLLAGDRISGTLSLPEGQAAPTGGISLEIQSNDIHSMQREYAYVTIAEDESAVDYILVQIPDAEAQWKISYIHHGIEPYIQKGFYAWNGTVWDSSKASLLDGGRTHDGINLRLLKDIPDSCPLADEVISGPILYEEDFHCSAESSITAGSPQGVVVGKGVHVLYSAPQIELKPGFSVNGGVFRAGNNLLP